MKSATLAYQEQSGMFIAKSLLRKFCVIVIPIADFIINPCIQTLSQSAVEYRIQTHLHFHKANAESSPFPKTVTKD